MNAYEYQIQAQRTECDQHASAKRIADTGVPMVRVMHAALGLTGEVGELAAAVEHWVYYRQELDRNNVKEELGDCLWYIAEMCNALDFNLEDVMGANLRKLKQRYPEKYQDALAEEQARNRAAERQVMLSSDYPRFCTRCAFTPVHKNNAIGICPNCIKPEEVTG